MKHTCNPSTQEVEAEGLKAWVSLGYMARPYLKQGYHIDY